MGFLSSLLGRADGEDEEEEELEEGREGERERERKGAEEKSPFPELNVGMSMDITVIDGPPLISGRLTAFSPQELTLERKPGQISFEICPLKTQVNARGLVQGMPIDIRGFVVESTRMKLRINDLKVIPYNESRNNFRLALDVPIKLFDPDDVLMENAEEARLVNLSVTGACFQSEYIHGEGEVLRMKFQILDYVPRALLGEVVRVTETKEGKFHYGFLFAQLDEQETTALTREMYNLQRGKNGVMLRHSYGHW